MQVFDKAKREKKSILLSKQSLPDNGDILTLAISSLTCTIRVSGRIFSLCECVSGAAGTTSLCRLFGWLAHSCRQCLREAELTNVR